MLPRKIIITLSISVAIVALIVIMVSFNSNIFFKPTIQKGKEGVVAPVPLSGNKLNNNIVNSSVPQPIAANREEQIQIIAENLAIPWAIDWLPDQTLLVTERTGNLLIINDDKSSISIEGVEHVGEGGLLGLAVHPDFATNQYIYLYLTTKNIDGLLNRVERYRLIRDKLSERFTIINNIPGAKFHDGGRIAFGPDGMLYITTGDAGEEDNAQDINSLAGKILRLNDDGTVPNDNPFGNEIYSYGHRNPQGLAWDDKKQLWASEHGRSGINSGLDEVNIISNGANYGWPKSQGDQVENNTVAPISHSGAKVTWAPAGIVYFSGSVFFTGLRGEALYQLQINKDNSTADEIVHFHRQLGRLRALKIGPDGFFYISTSNTDGRGKSKPDDDKIYKINPTLFFQQ